MRDILKKLGLDIKNSIVIGSGILQALGIRKSNDLDVVVTEDVYKSLKNSGKFKVKDKHGYEIIFRGQVQLLVNWIIMGTSYKYENLEKNSVIIEGVRYITLDFLYNAKKSWIDGGYGRQKDIDDLKLIEIYNSGDKFIGKVT